MLTVRKLVAIDIAGLGERFILAEFAGGVVLLVALAGLSLRAGIRGHVTWQILIGAYFAGLAVNYAPMLAYAIDMVRRGTAMSEVDEELRDKRRAYSRYRRYSLLLLAPLAIPVAILLERLRTRSALRAHLKS